MYVIYVKCSTSSTLVSVHVTKRRITGRVDIQRRWRRRRSVYLVDELSNHRATPRRCTVTTRQKWGCVDYHWHHQYLQHWYLSAAVDVASMTSGTDLNDALLASTTPSSRPLHHTTPHHTTPRHAAPSALITTRQWRRANLYRHICLSVCLCEAFTPSASSSVDARHVTETDVRCEWSLRVERIDLESSF